MVFAFWIVPIGRPKSVRRGLQAFSSSNSSSSSDGDRSHLKLSESYTVCS